MKLGFNIKGVIYGVIALALVIGGFIIIPSVMSEKSKPVDYVMVQREAIPEKILDMMDKYVDQERALAAKLDGKIYVIVTRGSENKLGIEMNKIDRRIKPKIKLAEMLYTFSHLSHSKWASIHKLL